MKRLTCAVALLAGLAGMGSAPAGAALFDLYFDENGNAAYDLRDGGGKHAFSGILADDPSQAGAQNVLIYDLGAQGLGPVTAGDVLVREVGVSIGCIFSDLTDCSDMIRFTNASGDLNGGGATLMIYYSEAGDPDDPDLADTGFPTNAGTGNFGPTQQEVGVEGNDSFVWFAGGAQGVSNDYYGQSDIPEPGTLALLGLGLAGLLGRRKLAA